MLSIIVAYDKNRGIGINNQLPWQLPADLAYFKKVTMGKPIIMGRKTHESIGRPLPGRDNIIITRNSEYQSDGCIVVHSIKDIRALELEKNDEEMFIIGGAEIFKELLDEVDKLYITVIEEEFQADTFFPEIDLCKWKKVSEEKGIRDEKNPYDYYFCVFEKNN